MLILLMMLIIGLVAVLWGFMMCFLPARWDRLTEAMSFARHWTEGNPKSLHPALRFGYRVAGLAIFGAGCWFTYMATSGIYLVLSGRTVIHTVPVSGSTSKSPSPGLSVLSVFMIIAGTLMAVFPEKAMAFFGRVWPAGQAVKPSAAPRVMLFVRLVGAFFAFLAIMSLLR